MEDTRPGQRSRRGAGWTFVHSIVDDYTRLAYSEPLPDEKGTTVAAFTARALNNFHQKSITHIMGWPPTWRPPRRWRGNERMCPTQCSSAGEPRRGSNDETDPDSTGLHSCLLGNTLLPRTPYAVGQPAKHRAKGNTAMLTGVERQSNVPETRRLIWR